MERLHKAGVEHIFHVTGRGSLFLSDALAKNVKLKAVSLHHEQSCAFAAIAYAEKRRGLGACMVSTGCASTNTITGVLSAWQDGVPCIFVSGQNVLQETTRHTGLALRTYGQQETDIVALVSPITKFSQMLQRPQDIVEVMDKALHAALSGRKGPVWLDVPLDLQSALIDPDTIVSNTLLAENNPAPSSESLVRVLQQLSLAKRPVLLIGKGIRAAGADELLRQLVEGWNLPLTYSASAPDIYGSANALSIGSVGAMGCSRAGNFAVQNSDFVLVLGSRLTTLTTGSDYCKFARSAELTVVDIDPVEHSKVGLHIDHFIHSDLKNFLVQLLKHTPIPTPNSWVKKCQHWKQIFSVVEPDFQSHDTVDLYQLVDRLNYAMPTGTTLVTDSGLVEVILPSNVHFATGMDCIHPTSQGSMGFALPAAIGAQHASQRLVLAVIGDGSIMMNLQEMESIRHQKLPIKIIVINNNVYSIIRRRQHDLFRRRTIGTDPANGVSCPDFAKVADCFGLDYLRIETIDSLDDGLTTLFTQPGPVLCEIMGRHDQGYIEMGHKRSIVNGQLIRPPLEDQDPFLPRDVFLQEMIIEPIDQ